jgi:hypothetical protein
MAKKVPDLSFKYASNALHCAEMIEKLEIQPT